MEVNAAAPQDGNVKFTATPKMGKGALVTGSGECLLPCKDEVREGESYPQIFTNLHKSDWWRFVLICGRWKMLPSTFAKATVDRM